MSSQALVNPFYAKFHTVEEDGTHKAFAFLVTKIDEGDHYSGAVWCDDPDNNAGLSAGAWNSRVQIGHGGPGSNVSWSAFED